ESRCYSGGMESTHLLYFKAIAEAESLTKAARRLHISQPALSKSLANLEKELGRSLFNRVGGRLYLNSDGKALLEYANQVDHIFEQIRGRFADEKERESLSLYSIGNYFAFLMKNYFQCDTRPLSLKVVPSAMIVEALFGGDADVAIADDRYLQVSVELGLKRIPILSEQLLLMVPRGHVLSDRESVDISELAGYPIMRLNTNFWLEDIAALNHVDLNLSWSVDSATWNYYWNSCSNEIPLCFDTSASFVTYDILKARRRRCSIVSVTGTATNRMLYLWYFEKNEERLQSFLDCVKLAFQ
ncbi:MAG: LysR family transcriptional regulator, partial [Oscillospiraceae bacterium]|nr:LysR family transcriptional regulator [Oscillospiraceae bacterium]